MGGGGGGSPRSFGGGVEGKQQPLRGVGWGLRTDHPKTGAMQAKKRLKNRSVFVTHPTPELDCPPLSKKGCVLCPPNSPGVWRARPPASEVTLEKVS